MRREREIDHQEAREPPAGEGGPYAPACERIKAISLA